MHARQTPHGTSHDSATGWPIGESVDSRPEGLDDARAFVTKHDRSGPVPLSVAHVEVGMTDAGGQHPHADLAWARFGKLEVFDPARCPGSFEYGGARHGFGG